MNTQCYDLPQDVDHVIQSDTLSTSYDETICEAGIESAIKAYTTRYHTYRWKQLATLVVETDGELLTFVEQTAGPCNANHVIFRNHASTWSYPLRAIVYDRYYDRRNEVLIEFFDVHDMNTTKKQRRR
jgi:hypothetical protein